MEELQIVMSIFSISCFLEYLIRDIVCDKCQIRFLSNYEYNKHIPTCRRIYGDI
jgi:hypothetical protein